MEQILHLTNNISEIAKLSEWAETIAEEVGLSSDKIFQMNLALEEVVVNVMSYAYPDQENAEFSVKAETGDNQIRFVIDDTGIPFDPTEVEEPDTSLPIEERPVGGLGIMLVKQFMKDVTYERKGNHNLLYLTMTIN